MQLGHLSDEALLLEAKKLAKEEKKLTTEILHHLREIEARRLFSDLGYSSLFNYAVKELGYSEGAAYRRIQAARLLCEVPEVENKLKEGSLSLTNLSKAVQHFRQNEIFSKDEKLEVIEQVENASKKECEKTLMGLSGKEPKPRKESVRRNSVSTHELKFTITEDTFQKLEELKGLLAHRGIKRLDELLEFLLDKTMAQIKKEKFKLDPLARRKSKEKTRTRYIPSGVKREVYRKSEGKCCNCGSTYKLEYDHIIPFSMGGESSERNLRLLCFSCNQRSRIKAGLRAGPAQIR